MAGALVKRAMSLELAVKELWSCIMSKDVGTVGFYCTPGVEKIRVLVEMYDNLCTKPHVFPFVIWTPVYDDFHVNIPGDLSKKIQDEIGGKIGFTDESWKSKTVEQKAADINEVLSGSRFVLLLDNIWDRVDLKQVGIPEPSHQNGSKLVFITTSLDVSRQMEAREKIKVVRFEPENVWGLFHEKFGHTLLNLNRHQHIPDIENEIVDWKKVFSGAEEHTLSFFPPVIREGVPIVQPPLSVIEDGAQEWKYSLVGQFIGFAPNFSSVQQIVEPLWGKNSTVKVSLAGPNLYVFSFTNAFARDWVLENGPWHIQNKSLILRKWEPNLKKLDFDSSTMPVWVELYNVPLELYTKKGLSYIASALGLPLYMDSITASKERLELAKVCLEIEAGAELPESIRVILRDGSVGVIRVSVPWLPPCCSRCDIFGHTDNSCDEKSCDSGSESERGSAD